MVADMNIVVVAAALLAASVIVSGLIIGVRTGLALYKALRLIDDIGAIQSDPYPASLVGARQTPLERKLTAVPIAPASLEDDDNVVVMNAH